jgi:hypothetical protein
MIDRNGSGTPAVTAISNSTSYAFPIELRRGWSEWGRNLLPSACQRKSLAGYRGCARCSVDREESKRTKIERVFFSMRFSPNYFFHDKPSTDGHLCN